jgi:hypothetical protein
MLEKVLKFLVKGPGTTVSVGKKFRVSISTADNWLRDLWGRGLLAKHIPKAGEYRGELGRPGRAPCIYSLTPDGRAAARSGKVPTLAERSKPKGPSKAEIKRARDREYQRKRRAAAKR